MRAWVWLAIAGCGRFNFDPRTTEPAIDADTTFTGPKADPLQLPTATGQVESASPPGASLAAGESYLDPTTGVRVWKLTDATTPVANPSARSEQDLGGAQVSAAWNDDHHTIAIALDQGTHYLVDLQRGVGTSNLRELVVQASEDVLGFTTDPANPQIAFAVDFGQRLHRVDTATNTVADVPPFPVDDCHTLPAVAAGGRRVIASRFGGGYTAIDTLTGAVDRITLPSINASLDHGGTYVTQAIDGTSALWRIGDTDTTAWLPPGGDFQNSAGIAGGFIAIDGDTGGGMPIYFADPDTRTFQLIGDYNDYDGLKVTGHWVQTDVAFDQQWLLMATAEVGFGPSRLDDAIGFYRLDGDLRLLLHHHGPDDPTFYIQPRATASPDGRIVVFTSTMGTGRSDVYAAEVPLTP